MPQPWQPTSVPGFGTKRPVAGNASSLSGVQDDDAKGVASMNKRSSWMWMILIPVLLLSGCGQGIASVRGGSPPRGVMSAARACRLVSGRASPGVFTGLARVHLVLTT